MAAVLTLPHDILTVLVNIPGYFPTAYEDQCVSHIAKHGQMPLPAHTQAIYTGDVSLLYLRNTIAVQEALDAMLQVLRPAVHTSIPANLSLLNIQANTKLWQFFDALLHFNSVITQAYHNRHIVMVNYLRRALDVAFLIQTANHSRHNPAVTAKTESHLRQLLLYNRHVTQIADILHKIEQFNTNTWAIYTAFMRTNTAEPAHSTLNLTEMVYKLVNQGRELTTLLRNASMVVFPVRANSGLSNAISSFNDALRLLTTKRAVVREVDRAQA